jgi:hypothetical protein
MFSRRRPQAQDVAAVDSSSSTNPGDVMKKVFGVVVVCVVLLVAGTASAQQSLTDKDRAEIQELSAMYAKALGGCAAEDYADVFLPETGYFASNIRGEVVGRERLIALVRSERHCINAEAQAAGPRTVPMVTIESNAKGVTGRPNRAAGCADDT